MIVVKDIVSGEFHQTLRNDVDSFFDKLRDGYVGTQSGNNTRLYFMGIRDGKEVIHAATIHERYEHKLPQFEINTLEYMTAQLYNPRRFWIFDASKLRYGLLRQEIILRQGPLSWSADRNEIQKKLDCKYKFKEELL